MYKKVFICLVVSIFFITSLASPIQANSPGTVVSVALPSFPIMINQQEINNEMSQYPLIVYRNITYFPLTWMDSRHLGLKAHWDGALHIDKSDTVSAYTPYKTSRKNPKKDKAAITTFVTMINGEQINNAKEPYPFLMYREATYVPMTWRFCVDAFGWKYDFTEKEGLKIVSDTPPIAQTQITPDRVDPEIKEMSTVVTIAQGKVYAFQPETGSIITFPLNAPAQIKTIDHQLPQATYGETSSYVRPRLYQEDGTAILSYHVGGATMGTTYLVRLNQDGSTSTVSSGRSVQKTFSGHTFSWWIGAAPGPGNLHMQMTDGQWQEIGDPAYLYGWSWQNGPQSSGGSGSQDAWLVGDDLYILACTRIYDPDNSATNGIYKVNIKTNATTRISEQEVMDFHKEGDHLYYAGQEGIYAYALSTGQETLLYKTGDAAVPRASQIRRDAMIFAIGGHVYWLNTTDNMLYDTMGQVLIPQAKNPQGAYSGSHGEYLLLSYDKDHSPEDRFVVINKAGKIIFRTADLVRTDNASITGQLLTYYNASTETICTVPLHDF